jgi:hypothetical protein
MQGRVRVTLACPVLVSACVERTTVREDQLAVLADMRSRSGTKLDRIRLVDTDGRVVEVSEDFDLTISFSDGRELVFVSPVVVEREEGDSSGHFVIRSGNLSNRRISLEDIAKVEVIDTDANGNVVAVGLAGIGAAAATVLIGLAAHKWV